ncbi:MAG: Hsp20/alpha crystallin family protein [Anaerolineae bacterium]|nr:Hsp20/alpha crystallin family protein [Anaerolineae bacterium]
MAKRSILPWRKEESKVPVKQDESDSYTGLQRDINNMFDDFFNRAFSMRPFGFDSGWDQFSPRVDVVDGDESITVTAELPGLDEKEIDLTLNQNVLQISGEKKAESEDKGRNYYRMERSYGMFRRAINLPCEVDAENVEATFKKGVLTITLPKVIEAGECKKITILH